MKKYNEQKNSIRKIAEKIKERLMNKYPNLSMREYIEKIAGYKQKYNFTDSEMDLILKYIFVSKEANAANPEAFDVNYNEMSKALGFVPASYNLGGKLHVKKEELDQLQMILTMAGTTKELHNQVTLQSLIYADCDPTSIQQEHDRTKVNIFSFIHPVVAALFIPKFELLEQHMLLASIAKIVADKKNGIELQTQPEYELYWDIATDPAETACVSKTKPFTDLANRCQVQTKLWEAVLQLRQGKYYTNDLTSFIAAIDNCKANVFDAADLAYIKDEGTIVRKLLAAFSIRPTIVMTMPVYGITPLTSHISPMTTSHITTLPIITMRIPTGLGVEATESIDLTSALSQQQLYIHHRQLTIKTQQILYSREILIFYVHRRCHQVNTARLTNPYMISSALPVTMGQFEKLNSTTLINFPLDDLKIGKSSQVFHLKSVVTIETKQINVNCKEDEPKPEIIYGCGALIRRKNNEDGSNIIYKYSPLAFESKDDKIAAMDVIDDKDMSVFTTISGRKGTLFIYKTGCGASNILDTCL